MRAPGSGLLSTSSIIALPPPPQFVDGRRAESYAGVKKKILPNLRGACAAARTFDIAPHCCPVRAIPLDRAVALPTSYTSASSAPQAFLLDSSAIRAAPED